MGGYCIPPKKLMFVWDMYYSFDRDSFNNYSIYFALLIINIVTIRDGEILQERDNTILFWCNHKFTTKKGPE